MMNLQYMAVINDSQIVGHTHRSHGIILHEGVVSSAVRYLLYYWEKEERKSLVGSFTYNYYCGPKRPDINARPQHLFLL